MKDLFDNLKNGIIKSNPVLILLLGLCPTLAVSTSIGNAFGMTAAVLFVLISSNIIVSLIRKYTPERVRIPVFIVIIATLVTIVDLTMQAFLPSLSKSLGIFIPLIVVNCIILGRAEAFAGKNKVIPSIFDGLGMGLGFTLALVVIASVREFLGNGTLLGIQIMPSSYQPMLIAILAPGAFLVMGFLMAILNMLKKK